MLTSGFAHASVTRSWLIVVVAASILCNLSDTKRYAWIEIYPHLWPYGQFWRIATWQICYTNSTELLFASMTIYQMRLVERLWGSRKFATFLFIVYGLNAVLAVALVTLLQPVTFGAINHVPAGPTPLIFAVLAQYYASIPQIYKYRLAMDATPTYNEGQAESGIVFSDKSTTYFMAGQLACSQLPGSLVVASVGWLVGLAWRSGIFPERIVSWRLPLLFPQQSRAGNFETLQRRLASDINAGPSSPHRRQS